MLEDTEGVTMIEVTLVSLGFTGRWAGGSSKQCLKFNQCQKVIRINQCCLKGVWIVTLWEVLVRRLE